MMALAGWCGAMAWLMWCERPQLAWLAFLGAVPAAVILHQVMVLVLLGAASVWLSRTSRRPPAADPRLLPEALTRFWQQVSVLLSAGLTFWQAVETAAAEEPLLAAPIMQGAQVMLNRSGTMPEIDALRGADGTLSLTLLQHGYLHGLSAEQIRAHVKHLEERLNYEREARRRRDPLWMTILPAVLLVNVLAVFVVPMILMAGHGWLKL